MSAREMPAGPSPATSTRSGRPRRSSPCDPTPRAGGTAGGGEGGGVVAGIGFRTACTSREIVALVRRALDTAGLPWVALAALATPTARANEAPVREAALLLGVPVLPVAPAALATVDHRVPTRSSRSLATHGVGSVAEAAAMAAAGADRLALARLTSPAATCALAPRSDP